MGMLDNKVAIVTGAAGGIGRATALVLAREGAKVVVSDISEDSGKETVQMVKNAGGDAIFVRTDVSKAEEVKALVDETVKAYGKLDIAVNNAGISGEANTTSDYSLEGWQQVIDVNLSSVFYGLKYQIPAMLANGGGSIINVASILGQVAFATAPAYVASKHGVVGLTKAAGQEYAPQGIRINSVGPAFIRTPMIEALEQDKAMNDMLVSLHPIGRLGEAEEVAEMIAWLASDRASFVVGSYFPVDGGYMTR